MVERIWIPTRTKPITRRKPPARQFLYNLMNVNPADWSIEERWAREVDRYHREVIK